MRPYKVIQGGIVDYGRINNLGTTNVYKLTPGDKITKIDFAYPVFLTTFSNLPPYPALINTNNSYDVKHSNNIPYTITDEKVYLFVFYPLGDFANASKWTINVASALINKDKNKIYVVKNNSTEKYNKYDKYIIVDNEWEKL